MSFYAQRTAYTRGNGQWRPRSSHHIDCREGPILEKTALPTMVGALQINRPPHSELQGNSKFFQLDYQHILKSWARATWLTSGALLETSFKCTTSFTNLLAHVW
jgi:chorismate synthase